MANDGDDDPLVVADDLSDEDRAALQRQADARDLDAELRLAFQVHSNRLALHTALRVSYEMPASEDVTPFPSDQMYFVPGWVLDACYDAVSASLVAKAAGGAGGRHARWLTRFRDEIRDQRRWVAVSWSLGQGLTNEEAIAAVAEHYCCESEATVRDAVNRVNERRSRARQWSGDDWPDQLSPAYQPVSPETFRQYQDPLGDEFHPGPSDHVDGFSRRMTALRPQLQNILAPHQPEYTRRVGELLRHVDAAVARPERRQK